jgi:hypothetical protein
MRNEERGSQPIGSLTSAIVDSLQVVDSTPEPLPSDSATGGLPSPARKASNSTGLQRGERGVGGKLSVWQADRGLEASFPAPLRTLLHSKAKYDSDFDTLLRYDELPPAKTPAGEAMLDRARQALDEALVPAEPAVVLAALGKLKLSVNPRNMDDGDARAQRRIYLSELREFPADVVVEACGALGRGDWFPNVGRLRDECLYRVNWRRVTREALG